MLNKQEIKKLIEEKKLIEGCIDLDTQLTPNGFDLTIEKISSFDESGALDFSNKERIIPECKELTAQKNPQDKSSPCTQGLDKHGWWHLTKGTYKIKTNETVNLPNDLIALAFTRTSLLRMGAFTQHGVWDAGFHGKGEFVLVVENPAGIKIKQNARVAQLVFVKVNETEKYNGIYNSL